MDIDKTMAEMYNEAVKRAPSELRPASLGEEMCTHDHIEESPTLGRFEWKCTKAKGHTDNLHVAHSRIGAVCHRWGG